MSAGGLEERVHRWIARREAEGALPPDAGVGVCVVQNGKTLFSGTYGLRERDRALPVTPDTVFEIGSLTKAFTATALLMASEKGGRDLDQPMNASKPLLVLRESKAARQVSISDVLCHRTGLPANDLLWYLESPSKGGLLEALGELELPPDAFRRSFTYNNLAYGALGSLFDELTGKSWESTITEDLLNPLGMASTSFRPSSAEQDVALPYVGTRRVARVDMSLVAAAGGLRSTLRDLARWMTFHLEGGRSETGEELLSVASLERMRSQYVVVDEPNPIIFQGLEWLAQGPVGYGLGWFLGSVEGRRVAFHPGLIDGFSTAIALVPEEHLGLLVLANVNLTPIPGLLIRNLLEALKESRDKDTSAGRPSSLPPEALAAVGRYENAAYGRAEIALRGGELALVYKGHALPLVWKSDGTADFVISAFGVKMPLSARFDSKDGRIDSFSIPFAMDPRVKAEVFVRRAVEEPIEVSGTGG